MNVIDPEFAALLAVDRNSRNVAGQEVGRELNAFERATDGSRKAFGEHGFAHTGHVFYQQVALGHQGRQGLLDHRAFADDHPSHIIDYSVRY